MKRSRGCLSPCNINGARCKQNDILSKIIIPTHEDYDPDEGNCNSQVALKRARHFQLQSYHRAVEPWILEYGHDITSFHLGLETSLRTSSASWERQKNVDARMREILLGWLSKVHYGFGLGPNSFYLAVNIIDRFCELESVDRTELDTLGIASLIIASKYEDLIPPSLQQCTKYDFTVYELANMEAKIIRTLAFNITQPTVYSSLQYLSETCMVPNEIMILAERSLMFISKKSIFLDYTQSALSAAAICCAASYCHEVFETDKLLRHTSLTKRKLSVLAKKIKKHCYGFVVNKELT